MTILHNPPPDPFGSPIATTIMVKQDIILSMAEKTGKSEYEARVMLEAMVSTVTESLQKGEDVVLRGFGSFKVKTRAPRMVRNIHTQEQYMIGKQRRVSFEPGKDLQID